MQTIQYFHTVTTVRIVSLYRLKLYMATLKRFVVHLFVFALGALIIFNSFPIFAFAATSKESDSNSDFMVSGWIPYWRDTQGIKDAKKHIKDIDTVYPFSYVGTADGGIKDLADMDHSDWKKFVKFAHSKDVQVIPTVMWNDAGAIHSNLSYESLRKKHIDAIVEMVEEGGYDGVDIDYESKFSSTKDHFSAFLTELKDELGDDKVLSCTIEARTPLTSLYKKVPDTVLYANDFKVIGKVCDRVQIMAYDQQRADIKLNDSKAGLPYIPVADADWVEKVIKETLKEVPAEKVVLGIATYGHHYEVTVAPNWFKDYRKVGALNLPDMLDVAKENNAKPSRNKAGEMGFAYLPKSSTLVFPKSLTIPKKTLSGDVIAQKALAYANKTGETVKFNYASYSDAGAIEQKIELAKEYELLGIALFKIDGEEDQKIWKNL